jgi:hypothetical protein
MNQLQKWALSYYEVETKNQKYKERDEFIKILTRISNPDLFEQAFANEPTDDPMGDGSGEESYSVEDIDELKEFLASLEKPQYISAGTIFEGE